MVCLEYRVIRLYIALSICLYPTYSTAAALRAPEAQGLNQPTNATIANHQLCFFSVRPKVSLPGDTKGKSYTTSTGFNCLDDGSSHAPECWNILELDDWLPHWFLKTPQCLPQAASDLDCNKQDPPEPWTTTFMRSAMRGGDWNACSDIGNTNCQYPTDACLGNDDAPLLRARYKYVAYTISNIHEFFSTWSNLMDSTMNQAADSVGSMISVVDPIKKTHTGLSLFLNILTFGLTLLSQLDLGLTTLGTALFSTVIGAIQKAPTVHDEIWPKQTAESQNIQIDILEDQLQSPNGIHTTILTNLRRTLEVVQGANQTTTTAFLAFASGGHFSADNDPSPFSDLGSNQKPLLQLFTTYLVSEALHQNGWHALIVPGANPLTIDQGTGPCPGWASGKGAYQCDWWNRKYKWMGCNSLDNNSMCDNYWWYSDTHNSAYALVKDGHSPSKEGGDLIRTILEKGWSTGALLFEDAAICEFADLVSQSASDVTYTADYNGAAGFFYQGPPFTGYAAVNVTTKFVGIAGNESANAFVAATWDRGTLSRIRHPDLVFGMGGAQWDARCVSQLNTTVANSWDPKHGKWTQNDGR